MPRRGIDLPSLVTAAGTVAGIEAGGTIKVLLELVELDIVISSSMNRARFKRERTWNDTKEHTF